ncbi:MAG: DUF6602 domain-containing protein [bacterium]
MNGLKDYISLISKSLEYKSCLINLFTGHGPTIGAWREHILIDLIREHIPKRFSVSSGFIYETKDRISPQIDIIIYDSLSYGTLFRFGDVVVVRPESVYAIIEVKSKLNKKNLEKAIEDSIRIRSLCKKCLKYDLLAYNGYSINTIKKYITQYQGDISHCLDSIACFEKGKNYTLFWFSDIDVSCGLHHSKKYPYFLELLDLDNNKNNQSLCFFLFSLLASLESIQGHFDKRFENQLKPNSQNYYLDYLKDDIQVNYDDKVILGEKFINE